MGVSGVKNLNTCILDFCEVSVVWSVWGHDSDLVFNLWTGPGFIFKPCTQCLFFQ